jgi:FkbM family methyltransferase
MSADLTPEGIRQLVGKAPIMLEIGCNDGTDTLKFLGAMPAARIHCFEPDPRAIARFKSQVDDDRVTLNEVAVGDTDGLARFYGSSGEVPSHERRQEYPCHFLDEWDLSGSLRRATGHLARSQWVTFPEEKQILTPVVMLDSWLADNSSIALIDFIWCDVQGAEDAVVRGGQRTLGRTRYFYTEFSNTPLYEGQMSLAALQAMLPGFKLLGVYGENALLRNQL